MIKEKVASEETDILTEEETKKENEKKICRSCGFQSTEKTLWICPSCHADTFEHEINLSPEDLANLKAGRSAF